MAIRHVSLIGANGKVGPYILQALLDAKTFQVTVLSRKSSKSKYPAEVSVVEIEDSLPLEQLVAALRGQDALVIAFAGSQTDNSVKLVDAAFEAGVQLVIPTDYGSCDSSDPRTLDLVPLYRNKKIVRDHLVELAGREREDGSRLTWTSLITGHFFDYGIKTGLLSMDVDKHTARVFDGGNARFSASTLPDIGFATARTLEHAGHAELTNKLVYVQSMATTQKALVASVERVVGAKFSIEEVSSDDYIREQKALLTGDADQDHEATEELVSVEGIVNADWQCKGDAFVNDLLGMPRRDLDELVKTSLS